MNGVGPFDDALVSTNGREWDRVGLPGDDAEPVSFFLAGGDVFVMATADSAGGEEAYWISEDARTWRPMEVPAEIDGGRGTLRGVEQGIVWIESGGVSDPSPEKRVGISEDGSTWTWGSIPRPTSEGDWGVGAIHALDGRWIAIGGIVDGAGSGNPQVWSSDDGVQWIHEPASSSAPIPTGWPWSPWPRVTVNS